MVCARCLGPNCLNADWLAATAKSSLSRALLPPSSNTAFAGEGGWGEVMKML